MFLGALVCVSLHHKENNIYTLCLGGLDHRLERESGRQSRGAAWRMLGHRVHGKVGRTLTNSVVGHTLSMSFGDIPFSRPFLGYFLE
jgi:hypothetical protein